MGLHCINNQCTTFLIFHEAKKLTTWCIFFFFCSDQQYLLMTYIWHTFHMLKKSLLWQIRHAIKGSVPSKNENFSEYYLETDYYNRINKFFVRKCIFIISDWCLLSSDCPAVKMQHSSDWKRQTCLMRRLSLVHEFCNK